MIGRRCALGTCGVPATLATLATLVAACRGGDGKGWDWERMREQPRYEAYGESRFFPDGRAMRTPPAGTVPRERVVGPAALVEGREGGAYVARIPLPVTDELIARGRSRFGIYCAVCHGEHADGRSVVARNMPETPPPSLVAEPARSRAPGYVYVVATDGLGRMPSYAHALDVRDRWAVVAYLATLQRATLQRATLQRATVPAADRAADTARATGASPRPSR